MSAPDWQTELDEILRASWAAGPDEKVRLLEAAVRLADHHGDVDRGFQMRSQLINAATFGGHPDKALVAFAWCRARAQEDPRRMTRQLLWEQKWVVNGLADHLGVTRAQIAAAHDDYAATVDQQGGGARSVHKLRMTTAQAMGDVEDAQRWFVAWKDTRRDGSSDCAACDLSVEVGLLHRWGRHEEALAQVAPILAGRLSCAEVPHVTLRWVVLANFALGRLEEARQAFSRGYPLIRSNRKHLNAVAIYLAFLALTGNDGPALTLFERHLEWALDTRSPRPDMDFFRAARFLFERVSATEEKVALRLPQAFPLHDDEGLYDVRALHDWCDARSADLAGRLDARNGNTFYTDQLEASRRWAQDVKPFPILTGLG